ncbi:hypothetical protein [Halobacterium sp. R2-5]|uniref:hypothetical protein n=1 Tax=Halobacterium sp. R2-5 TaxID=2715751 RepID=UPI00142285FC|nr:hypothetical protein [Halobacterium sp. R2-5]NIC00924.1 hypothetical protein [Halobacterium sp. R2-5]
MNRYATDGEGIIHLLTEHWLSVTETAFGYQTLCEPGFSVPIEGEDFELQDPEFQEVHCEQCQNASHDNSQYEEYAVYDSHLVGLRRNDEGRILVANLLCLSDAIENLIPFETVTFEGDLYENADRTVCTECWDAYTNRQWSARAQGCPFQIKVDSEDELETLYAEKIQGHTTLQLTSSNGLTKQLQLSEVDSISANSPNPTKRIR